MSTITQGVQQPKSYLSDEERQGLLLEVGINAVYLAESTEATLAGDEDAAWEWFRLAELSASTLAYIKAMTGGADFIREQGLITTKADEQFGQDWLDSA